MKKNYTKIKQNVLRNYPDAKIITRTGGECVIMIGEYIPADEYLLPSTECVDTAWEYAQLSLKTTQHFNRTHPNRMSLAGLEYKLNRINNRRSRGTKISKR